MDFNTGEITISRPLHLYVKNIRKDETSYYLVDPIHQQVAQTATQNLFQPEEYHHIQDNSYSSPL